MNPEHASPLRHFYRIASGLAVDEVLDELAAQPAWWDQITARQTTPGSPHGDTRAIFLRWSAELSVQAVFNDLEAADYPALESLPRARALLEECAHRAGLARLARAMIVSLRPGGRIVPHVDEGAYAQRYARYHCVLQSDEGNIFRVGDEFVHLRPGEPWRFDHRREHAARNASARERIHLIFDGEGGT